MLTHDLEAHEVDQGNLGWKRRQQRSDTGRVCCFVDPDRCEHRCELLYQPAHRASAEPALRDRNRFHEHVAMCERPVARECREKAFGLVVKLIIVVQQRVQGGGVDEDQEREASANSRSCS